MNTVTLSFVGEGYTLSDVLWLLSDTTIATIDDAGKLTRVKDGTVFVRGSDEADEAWLQVAFQSTFVPPRKIDDSPTESGIMVNGDDKDSDDTKSDSIKTGDNYANIKFFAISALIAEVFFELCLKKKTKVQQLSP